MPPARRAGRESSSGLNERRGDRHSTASGDMLHVSHARLIGPHPVDLMEAFARTEERYLDLSPLLNPVPGSSRFVFGLIWDSFCTLLLNDCWL